MNPYQAVIDWLDTDEGLIWHHSVLRKYEGDRPYYGPGSSAQNGIFASVKEDGLAEPQIFRSVSICYCSMSCICYNCICCDKWADTKSPVQTTFIK